jgi:competence protein ComEC
MKRPLVLFLSALVAGILAAYVSNSYLVVVSTIIAAISLFIILPHKFHKNTYIFLLALLFYTAGAFQSIFLNNLNIERFKGYEGEQAAVNGIICSEPDVRENRIKYIVKVLDITCGGRTEKPGGKILLTTLPENDTGYIYEYGRRIHIEGRIDIPKEKRNPGGFNYRLYLAQSGVSAMIFAKNNSIKPGEIENRGIFAKAGIAVRHGIIKTINASLPSQQAGLLNGMLIGYRGGLSKTVQQAFCDSGLMHIMAVSGANVAFIVIPLVFIFKKAGLKRKSANLIIMGILVFFLFITGFEPSVVRAVIMALVVLAGQIIYREADIFTSLSFSAIILLLYNPYTLFNIGFQLSYAATISLVLFSKNIKNIIKCRFMPDFAADAISVTMAAQAGVLPVSILYFNKVSVISIISNILALPAAGIITVLGLIMAVLGQVSISLSKLIGYVNCTLLSFILFITKVTSSLTFSTVRVSTPSFFLVAAYYATLWFFLWYKPRHKIRIGKKYYKAAAILLLMVFCIYFLRPGGLEVVFIDVGEGDSAFIRTCKGRTVLIDGGGYNTKLDNENNIGDTVIIPFLLDYGVSKLDLVVATHGHDDHVQGLIPVLENFKVGCFIIPDNDNKDEFAIDPAHRRKGYGSTAFNMFIEQFASDKNISEIFLAVAGENNQGKQFWEKQDFQEIKKVKHTKMRMGLCRDITIMRRKLA